MIANYVLNIEMVLMLFKLIIGYIIKLSEYNEKIGKVPSQGEIIHYIIRYPYNIENVKISGENQIYQTLYIFKFTRNMVPEPVCLK